MHLLILGVTLGYAIGKFADLITGKDPIVTESKEPDYYGPEDELKLTDTRFRIAVGGRSATGGEDSGDRIFDHDPQYVRWIARHRSETEGFKSNKAWLLHDCNGEDWDQFNPLKEKFKKTYDQVTGGGQSSF